MTRHAIESTYFSLIVLWCPSQPASPKAVAKIFFAPLYFWGAGRVPRGKDCMPRTVVQIAADPSYLCALCNDGQIFRLVNHAWQPLEAIPQDDLGGAAQLKSEIDPFKDEQPGG
jgi:hypothetical protein